MVKEKNYEVKTIFWIFIVIAAVSLLVPTVVLMGKSFETDSGFSFIHYVEIFQQKGFGTALFNSVWISSLSAVMATVLAFIMAYTIHYTNLPEFGKKAIRLLAVLPMLLPTITYGFAIIYSFGKQGLITKILGRQLFDIYGVTGLLIGYVIYTVPIAFLLVHNTMGYVDKKFSIVSNIMGDSAFVTFMRTVIRPLVGTLASSFIQCFFLCFTDFGIPASVGGRVEVIATVLYNKMLGSIPDFNKGAVVAIIMLLPSILSIVVMYVINKYNVRYNKISIVEIKKNPVRDLIFGILSTVILVSVLAVFATIIVVPFVKGWPYDMSITLENFEQVFSDRALTTVYTNSLLVALLTSLFGTIMAFGAAVVTSRSTLSGKAKMIIESVSTVTNTIPGMVLGIAYMLAFSGTPLQNTVIILILCNMIHFFATPYTMAGNTLQKMNLSWEKTAKLMGDNWIKTMFRVVIPNSMRTLIEIFSYYFVNAMVTVSAVVFLAGAKTMVITTKIKELQHFAKFNEIFVLSLLILLTNLVAKAIVNIKFEKIKETFKMKRKTLKKLGTAMLVAALMITSATVTGCGQSEEQVTIYTNADDEAVEAMKNALDKNGYEGQYLLQSFGTSELGGKLLAEGTNIEADLITMSSFYIDSAQNENQMFQKLTFETGALETYPEYYTPITSQEGAIIYNTQVLQENNLPVPTSIADLAKPEYKGFISVTDIQSSSTAWLLIQALVNEYGEDGAKEYLTAIYANADAHIESSGSGPIKKARSGEVAIGFGLRHQAVADKEEGLPIDYVDPTEGNFTLTESVAVIDKKENTNPKAMAMAECIIKNGRAELLKTYPIALYEGETVDSANSSNNPKVFGEPLTAELLKKHQELSESCK